MISVKYVLVMALGFVAGAFIFASPIPQAIAAVIATDVQCTGCVGASDLASSAVTNSKIGSSAVSNSKIGSNAVTTGKIADGTVGYADVSRSLIAVEHRDDCNCGGTGWDPVGGNIVAANIYDDRIKPSSVVSVSLAGGFNVPTSCWTEVSDVAGYAQVRCSSPIPNGYGVNYAIFTNPAYN